MFVNKTYFIINSLKFKRKSLKQEKKLHHRLLAGSKLRLWVLIKQFVNIYFMINNYITMSAIFIDETLPLDSRRKLNIHKTFRRRPGRLLNVLYTLNLRPVFTVKEPQLPLHELKWEVLKVIKYWTFLWTSPNTPKSFLPLSRSSLFSFVKNLACRLMEIRTVLIFVRLTLVSVFCRYFIFFCSWVNLIQLYKTH